MINFDKIDLNRLYYFYYVATCKNITRGAHEANIHQSGMTRHMMALEKEIGTKLLNRHSEGVTLTRAGEEVFSYAQRIAREVGAIRKQLDEKDKISGKIRICTTYAIANYILAEHLIEFNKIYPSILFDVVCNDHVIDLVKNDVDVAIRPYDPEMQNIIQTPLFKLQGKLYASNEYIQQNGFPITEQDLINHKFIAYSRSENIPSYYPIDWFLKIEGCTTERNCILRTNSVEFGYKSAQLGLGIVVGHETMDILRTSKLINVAPNVKGPEYNAYFIYPENTTILNRVEVFKNFLKNKLENKLENKSEKS